MKTSQLKMMIREVVREEIRLGLKEVLGEVKRRPIQKTKQKQIYSKNPILNEVLNETAISETTNDEWKTMGKTPYTTERMNEVVGSSYADMMNGNSKPNADTVVTSMGGDPNSVGDTLKNALTRDYSDLMKAMDKKQGK